MHRASSTLADRLASHGLLLLRVIVAAALMARCLQLERNSASLPTITPHVIAAIAGLFVLFGLWMPVAAAILAVSELLIAYSHGHDPWLSVLLAGLGIVLALLGPGTWSVDSWRSGWKRIEIRRPEN